MGWTKKQIIDDAFGELALAGYEFDITPEEREMAKRRLDAMLATWEARGVRVGYAFASGPGTSDIDADSGLPDAAVDPVVMNLAVRLSASMGKVAPATTKKAAAEGLAVLMLGAAFPEEQQLPSSMPRGAGNRPWRTINRPFFTKPDTSPLQTSEGGDLDITSE